MEPLTLDQFQRLFPALSSSRATEYLAPFSDSLDRYEINTELRVAAYAAQIGHESNDLQHWQENLNYTNALRIRAVWPRRFTTQSSALPFVRNPEALANEVYGGRMGNQDEGDGWKYRGRGPIQATGRSMYDWLQEELGITLLREPDLLLQPAIGFAASAAIYVRQKACNPLADTGREGDFVTITKKINGGTHGLTDRKSRWLRAQRVLGIHVVECS